MGPTAVTLKEIERIFEILDRRGLSREAVTIPLRPASPGRIHTLPSGKVEIAVDAERPFEEFLADLDAWLAREMGG